MAAVGDGRQSGMAGMAAMAPAARERLMLAQEAQLHLRADDPRVFAEVGAAVRVLLDGRGSAGVQEQARLMLGLAADWRRADGDAVAGGLRGSALASLATRGTLGRGADMARRLRAAVSYGRARDVLAAAGGPARPGSALDRWQGGAREWAGTGTGREGACQREVDARALCRAVEAGWRAEPDGLALARVVERIVIDGDTLSGAPASVVALVRGTSASQKRRASGALLCRALDVAAGVLTGVCASRYQSR